VDDQELTVSQAQNKLAIYTELLSVGVVGVILSSILMVLAISQDNKPIFFSAVTIYLFSLGYIAVYGFRCASMLTFLSQHPEIDSES
jgi:hypothetical protein